MKIARPSNKFEQRNPFFDFVKNVEFQNEVEKIPQARAQEAQARAQEARARARHPGPNGLLFQTHFGNGLFVQKTLKQDPDLFLKIGPRPIFKNVTGPFLKDLSFSKGCKLPVLV